MKRFSFRSTARVPLPPQMPARPRLPEVATETRRAPGLLWGSLLALMLTMTLSRIPSASAASPRDADWKAVESAVAQGQPRTAADRLKPIAEAALRERAWGEAAKAIARGIALETQIQGQRPEERVTRLADALRTAPEPLQPVFHALLGRAYWNYFQQNNWRIRQRTATTPAAAGEDFKTWDLKRLFAEIDRQFSLALAQPGPLQRTPIADFDALLERGTAPDNQRPTLFDFLTHEAIGFYASGEQAGARPEDAFIPTAASPILGTPEEFLAWKPATTTTDTNAVALKAIGLFQSLLRFHQADTDRSAWLDADLERIRFAGNVATGPDKDDRHIAALKDFVERAAGNNLAAFGHHEWAQILHRQEKFTEAHRVASQGAQTFPGSAGASWCRNLIDQIQAPSASLLSEKVWSNPRPDIQVRYRNLTHVWFRAVAVNWEDFLDRRRPRPENLNPQQRREYLNRPVALAWDAELPPTTDYREWRHDLPAPDGLAPGYYLIFASHRADFSDDNNALHSFPVWVSDLALVVRPRAGNLEGFVLDARSGEPVSGATLRAWYLGTNGERVGIDPQTTDELGFFAFRERKSDRGYLIEARKGDQRVSLEQDVYWPRPQPNPNRWQETLLFTDRALYRPGQSVQYKGISIRHDRANTNYQVMADRSVTVIFRDPNGKEIARQQHRANNYGSFAGTFTAPRDRLNGSMSLVVEGDAPGAIGVSVEEYKRPKFHADLDTPKAAPRLGEAVQLTGRALAYTGAAVDGAQVKWRVTRQVRFPPWWGWFRHGGPMGQGSQEIAHGTAVAGTDGSFTIEFKATPDASVAESDQPIFLFSVHADVTDAAGETRSAQRSVQIGYTALEVEMTATDWQVRDRAVEIRIATQSLDDAPQAAEGTVRIHRVARPPKAPRSGPRSGQVEMDEQTDPNDPNRWPLGEKVTEMAFRTEATGATTNRFELAPGLYRAVLETRDRFGKTVKSMLGIRVLDLAAPRLGLDLPQLVAAPAWEIEPGKEFEALWGTGFETGRAFVEFEHRDRMVERFWTPAGRTQQSLRLAVTEAMRGGFTLHVTQVRNNQGYLESRPITVPWSNKELDLTWETFRSRLEPGSPETWTAVIKPRKGQGAVLPAELVATLYDASLDQFRPHRWAERFHFWPIYSSSAHSLFANGLRGFLMMSSTWPAPAETQGVSHRRFPDELTGGGVMRFAMSPQLMSRRGTLRGIGGPEMVADSFAFSLADGPVAAMAAAPASAKALNYDNDGELSMLRAKGAAAGGRGRANAAGAEGAEGPGPDPSKVTARQNLQETAFFLPQLTSDSNGVVRLSFTLPEALTEWRFLGFAHDRELRSGLLTGTTVTAKDLMVQPNPPRFLREGDELEFTVKVSNQSTNPQTGRIRLDLTFAQDGQSADQDLGNRQPEQGFQIPAKESRTLSWRLRVPDGCGFLRFKAVAATDRLSDGEEGYLPVLSRRIHLTESLPLPIRGPATRKFTFTALKESGRSRTLRHDGITVQMVSQPAWYAVLALPYLMEYPHECSEQIFNRYYANALARHIATSDPKIRSILDQWRATPALDSPLEKNADLKSIALEETPWLRDANQESESRRRVGLLFEDARLESELQQTLQKLAERQLPEGGWSWFPGGPRDEYITLYIVAGFGRLRDLGAKAEVQPALASLNALDGWMNDRYQALREKNLLEKENLDATVALYLYARTLFLTDNPVAEPHAGAFDYWIGQARQHWLKVGRQSQAHIALAIAKLGNRAPASAASLPQTIVKSLLEHSVVNEELGRFWRDEEFSWSWHRAPIETQALMIEALSKITHDTQAVDDCQVWLLKQKQTQAWKSTKATADAVYALLLGGRNLLGSDALVEVELGGKSITPGKASPKSDRLSADARTQTPGPAVEAGTGFYQVRIPGAEVSSKQADIVVRKTDTGVSWGSVHWQYFEDLDRVKPFAGTPLKLTKSAFVRESTKAGQRLVPVKGAVKVGDELVIRIELRVDRDLEYVHLKDQRGSGTEPVNVLSGYRFQDGLGYYESTRDTASHFFIGYLAKGTYVFEYPVRVQHRGAYTTGVASVQCLYAPEFNSHSGSVPLSVK